MKKHVGIISTTVPVTQEQAKLRKWAKQLRVIQSEYPAFKELADKLDAIGLGVDANNALGVKRRAGRNATKDAGHLNSNLAVTWVAAATLSEGAKGLGLTQREALIKASELFQIDLATLERYWRGQSKTIINSDASFDLDALRPQQNK